MKLDRFQNSVEGWIDTTKPHSETGESVCGELFELVDIDDVVRAYNTAEARIAELESERHAIWADGRRAGYQEVRWGKTVKNPYATDSDGEG